MFVSQHDILNRLAETEIQKLKQLESRRSAARKQLKSLGEDPESHEALAQLAHSLFNLKEFIYIR